MTVPLCFVLAAGVEPTSPKARRFKPRGCRFARRASCCRRDSNPQEFPHSLLRTARLPSFARAALVPGFSHDGSRRALVHRAGFEPARPKSLVSETSAFASFTTCAWVRSARIELAVVALSTRCRTIWLTSQRGAAVNRTRPRPLSEVVGHQTIQLRFVVRCSSVDLVRRGYKRPLATAPQRRVRAVGFEPTLNGA